MDDRTQIEARLRRFSAARRHVLNATLAYRLGVRAAVAGAVAIPLLSGWITSPYVNALLSLALVVTLLVLAVTGWRRAARFRSVLHEAFAFEALEGDLNSRLVSALDFLQRGLDTPLTQVVVGRATDDLARAAEARLDRAPRNRWRRRFGVVLVPLVLAAANPWCGLSRSIPTVRDAWLAVFDVLFPVRYERLPAGARTVARIGEPVEVGLRFLARAPRVVELVVADGDQTVRTRLQADAAGRFATNLTRAVETELAVSFAFGARELPPCTVVFTTEPELLNMQAELIYPGYTRMVPRNLEGIQTRLAALAGTRMTLGFTFSKPLRAATIAWEDGETLPLEAVGRFATVSLMHTRGRRATLQVVDQHGWSPRVAPAIEFALQRDEPPRLFVPGHLGEDMPMVGDAVALFGFGVRAEDDFGITRCVLTWRQSTVDNPTQIVREGEIERLVSPVQRRAVTAFETIFEGLALSPGDRISLELAAFDNRAPTPQVTRARPLSFFVHQDDLGGLSLADLGFGGGASARRGRIARAKRSTTVKEPDAVRTVEQLRVDWDAPIDAPVVAPAVRGEHGQAARDYFRLLSDVAFETEDGTRAP